MVKSGPGRNGSKWRRIQAQCMADGEYNRTPCYLCGKPINYAFSRALPATQQRAAPSSSPRAAGSQP